MKPTELQFRGTADDLFGYLMRFSNTYEWPDTLALGSYNRRSKDEEEITIMGIKRRPMTSEERHENHLGDHIQNAVVYANGPVEGVIRIVRVTEQQSALIYRSATSQGQLFMNALIKKIRADGLEAVPNDSVHSLEMLQKTLDIEFAELKRGLAVIYLQDKGSRENLAQVQRLIQLDRLEQSEIGNTLDAIRRILRFMQLNKSGLDSTAKNVLEQAQSAIESELSLHQRLELTLPVIPFFLEYKIELSTGSQLDLKAVLEEAGQRWQGLLGRI